METRTEMASAMLAELKARRRVIMAKAKA